jgi:YfiH family protein
MVFAQVSTADTCESLPSLSVLRVWSMPHLVHGFMTREGGVSEGSYRSFNLAEGVGDDVNAVCANWAKWHCVYGKVRIARLRQVHGIRVRSIGSAYDGALKIGDGMVTALAGTVLAVFTADCVPVLMVDAERGIVGALHAGWRGTLAGIASEGMSVMAAMGTRLHGVRVALGPSIGSCCFEVDAELADRFVAQIPAAAACCLPGRAGKKHLDLRGILRAQFREAGVDPNAIVDVGPCTRCNPERFFSRRAADGAMTGLQMSFIGFVPEQ